jgi:hypothetical protein
MSTYYDSAGLDYSYGGYNDYGYGYQAGGRPTYSDYSGIITKSPVAISGGADKPPRGRPFYADTPVEERVKAKPTAKTTTSPGGAKKKRKNSSSHEDDAKESSQVSSDLYI